MTEELKPCVHCGSKDLSIETYALGGNKYTFEIMCLFCETQWRTITAVEAGDKPAIEKWNRRASPWVRVEDGCKMPNDGDKVLILSKSSGMHGEDLIRQFFYCEDDDYDTPWRNGFGDPVNPDAIDYWMPIPELLEN